MYLKNGKDHDRDIGAGAAPQKTSSCLLNWFEIWKLMEQEGEEERKLER